MQEKLNMTLYKNPFLRMICVLFFLGFVQCNSKNDGKPDNTSKTDLPTKEEKELAEIKKTAKNFCTQLANKNYSKMSLYSDKSTQAFFKEIKDADDRFLNNLTFIQVDTCTTDVNTAYCTCLFENNYEDVVTTISLIKYTTGWLVHLVWNHEYPNPFIMNTSHELRTIFPEETPQISDSLTAIELQEILDYSLSLIHFPEVIINYMEKERLRTNLILPSRNSRIDLTTAITYGKIIEKDEYKTLVNYSNFTFGANHMFTSNKILEGINFTFSPEDKDQIIAYFQSLALLISQKYGLPYNINKSSTENQLYHYKQLKWFVKGFNEELVLMNGNSTLELMLVAVKKY
jgi:hypothetical protein